MRFRALPITVKQEFIDMCTAEKLVWEETETSPAITLTSDQLNELMEYQLRQSSWSFLQKDTAARGTLGHCWRSCAFAGRRRAAG
jgi:hypothetical protein